MLRIAVRTGYLGLAMWPLVMAALVWFTADGVKGLYPDDASRLVYHATVGASPASMAFNGRGYNLDGLGGITAYEVGFFGLLLLPIVAAHLAIRHTRAQEDAGRVDLVTAASIGRLAPLLGAMLAVTGALMATGLITAALLISTGLSLAGSSYYALALVLHMLVFAGVGLLAGQLAQTARGAYALTFAVIGSCYVVRAIIDGRGWPVSWLTPMGWLAEVRAFGDVQLWPYIAFAVLFLALFAAALTACWMRDLDAGLVAPRPGPAAGSARLRGPLGLLWRITRGIVYGWSAGAAAWGFALGLLSEETGKLLDSNPGLAQVFGGSTTKPQELMTSVAGVVVALLACAVALQGLVRLAAEESSGRLGLVLASRYGRNRWWLTSMGLLAVDVLAVLFAGGLGYGLGATMTTGQVDQIQAGPSAALAYYPATLLVTMIGGTLLAMSSRLVMLAWVIFLWAAIVAMLADTLQLPDWLRNLSPLQHTGRVPVADLNFTAVVVMFLLTVTLLAFSTVWLRRRDLAAG